MDKQGLFARRPVSFQKGNGLIQGIQPGIEHRLDGFVRLLKIRDHHRMQTGAIGGGYARGGILQGDAVSGSIWMDAQAAR